MTYRRNEWSQAETELLADLLKRPGISVDQIARTLGKPPRAITTKMERMGFRFNRPPSWTPDRIKRLEELWRAGLTASQIATRLGGITRNAVIGKLHRLNLADKAPREKPKAGRTASHQKTKRRRTRKMMKPNPLLALMALPLPEEPKDEIARTTIVDRERDQCAWVIGEPRELKCCGAPIIPGLKSPYCLDHARRAYSLPTVERREFILPDIQEAIARKQARQAGEMKDAEPEKEAA